MTDGTTAVNIAITLKQFALLGIPSWHDINNAFQCLVETCFFLWIVGLVGMKTYVHCQNESMSSCCKTMLGSWAG